MGTSALSSEMSMGRRPIAKSGLFSLVPIEEVHLQGGCLFGWWRSPFPFVAVVYRNLSPCPKINLHEERETGELHGSNGDREGGAPSSTTIDPSTCPVMTNTSGKGDEPNRGVF